MLKNATENIDKFTEEDQKLIRILNKLPPGDTLINLLIPKHYYKSKE